EWYLGNHPFLVKERCIARQLAATFNHKLDYEDAAGRLSCLRQLLGGFDEERPPFIEPPLRVDYGYNITVGKDFYCNFDTTILDICPVTIGDRVLLGPGVHIYAVNHPLNPEERFTKEGVPERGAAVTVGDDVWIGGRAVLLPGVTVGSGSVIAAGAVVTKDVPSRVVVAGNPAKVIKHLD
ncbi:hypothetical protein H632_c2175p0, partial [Helicosporidium sp. ATCC 50920]